MDPILAQLSNTVPKAASVEELTRPLLKMLGAVTGLESTYLTSIDPDREHQQVRYALNTGDMTIPEGLSVPWSDTLCRRAIEENCWITTEVPERWGDSEAARQLKIQTYVSAPVRAEDGELMGTLCGASSARRPLNPEAESILQLFSNLVANYVQRERLLERLQTANTQLAAYAMTDVLTGLPNRRALYESLQEITYQAVRDGHCILVALIDLDGFKAVNDTHGHLAGDRFLQLVGQRLQQGVRDADRVGRLGGDEFLVVGLGPRIEARSTVFGTDPVLTDGDGPAAALLLQQRALQQTVGQYDLGSTVLDYPGASVGALALRPHGLDPDAAVKLADARMYEVKRERRARSATPDGARR